MARQHTFAIDDRHSTPSCLDVALLELLAGSHPPALQDAVAHHLQWCERCHALLAEMRNANSFLSRFRSTNPDHEHSRTKPEPIRIRGYAILGLLGYGGQGEVYKALQEATGREVAIKVPLGSTQRKPSTRYRFQREVELLARLDHPGIVKIYGACELDDDRIGCVMEYVDGQSIDLWADRQRATGRDGLRQIIEVIASVSDAIAYAHQRAVLHRDIKPSNVMISPAGRPLVLDFGLAKSLDDSDASFATNTGAFIGTLVYASPEQLTHGGASIDLYTDVYALGLLLYQTVTGKLPYSPEASTTEIMRQIREVVPSKPSEWNPVIGAELDAITLKALAKEKERRYSNAGEFRDDLKAWLAGHAVRARFDSQWYVLRKALWRRKGTVVGVVAGLSAAVAVWVAGFESRVQTAKARLAGAVRDTQIVESHKVRMAEARISAADNFIVGETAAWDALLEPSEVLVSRGLEGVQSHGLPAASPAYWALWEMYLKTPVVGSVPRLGTLAGSFSEVGAQFITIENSGLTWWEWPNWVPVRHLTLQEEPRTVVVGHGRILVRTESGQLHAADANGTRWQTLGEHDVYGYRIGAERVATVSLDRNSISIWDSSQPSFRLVRIYEVLAPGAITADFDVEGQFLGIVEQSGRVTIIDAENGEIVLEHPGGGPHRLSRLCATPRPGMFVAWGQNGAVQFRVDKSGQEPSVEFFPTNTSAGVPTGAELFLVRPGVDRILARTNQSMVSIMDAEMHAESAQPLRNILNVMPELSHDGDAMSLNFRDIERVAIYSLDTLPARRLPFPSPPSSRGHGTLFDIAFDRDSAKLYAASIDGTVRTYALEDPTTDTVIIQGVSGGVSRIALSDNGIVVGGHDVDVDRADITMFDVDGTATVLAHTGRRLNTILVEGTSIWALASSGELLHIDLITGVIVSATNLIEYFLRTTPRSLAVMPHGGPLLIAVQSGPVIMLRRDALDQPLAITMPLGIRRLLVHPTDPGVFLSAGDDGMIRIWRLGAGEASAELVREIGSHAGPIYCLAVHPNGRLIATGGGAPETRDVRIWDMQTGRELAALDLFEMGVFDIEFSPNGRWLAACGEVRMNRPEEGGQLFLLDLYGPQKAMAGNLEYHIARFARDHGHEPSQAEGLRRLFQAAVESPD